MDTLWSYMQLLVHTHFLIGILLSDVSSLLCYPSAFQGERLQPGEDEFREALHSPLSLPKSFAARRAILLLMVSSSLLQHGARGVTLACVLPRSAPYSLILCHAGICSKWCRFINMLAGGSLLPFKLLLPKLHESGEEGCCS